ncbi:hypothetical protein AURDEDRAFT_146782 [Auricularia subglabra TFB-10046 SS5]|nr:hypothetical protein AURDEDRAFT_146782 [Auricularia subglabra TFB-10046 SS5]
MQDQLDAANRTCSVLRNEIARLNEIRYTTSASKTVDLSTPKLALGPSNTVNAEAEAGPSNARPVKSTSPGSKENALPQASQPSSAVVQVAPEATFGRIVLQCLRSLPWPGQGHMWLNMMVLFVREGRVSLQVLCEAYTRDSGTIVNLREFGAMVQNWGEAVVPGGVRVAGDLVAGLTLRDGVAEGARRPAAPVPIPVTPRAPPAVAPPRGSMPTPATAPRPPAPAGPRPPPPPRAAPPHPPSAPRTAPLPSSPAVKTEPGTKRRAADGDVGGERPVKRPRSGSVTTPQAPSSSPAPTTSSSPTHRIASSSRAAAQTSIPFARVAPPSTALAKPPSSAQAATPNRAHAVTADPKPTPTPPRAGPPNQATQARAAPSSPGQGVSPRAGPFSSSQPAARAARPSPVKQEPPQTPLHPEQRRQAAWDIDKSGVEDLFVLWLRQGALRDISSEVPRGVAVQRAADALRRLGWASTDGASFVVPTDSREYRHARFGKLTIAKSLGFFDW